MFLNSQNKYKKTLKKKTRKKSDIRYSAKCSVSPHGVRGDRDIQVVELNNFWHVLGH